MSYSKDKQILRELAFKYAQVCFSDDNFKKMQHHKDVNDLKAKKPILLIDEIPWWEFDFSYDDLIAKCEDERCVSLEKELRRQLFLHKYIPADAVFRPFVAVKKVVNSTGIGITRKVDEHQDDAKSHTFPDQLKTEEDLEKLHFETISYDKETTLKNQEFIADLIGDIIPTKLVGEDDYYTNSLKTIDDITYFRGLDTILYDFIDRPEFMHKTIRKFTDIFINRMEQLEALDLLEGDSYICHAASALSDDLKKATDKVRRENIWGRGLAQIFASVSPDMHNEFDTQYMIEALKPFGLVYYGCCEPLDKKIDILSQIPNLRKISITPWADVDNACAQMQRKYVVSSKPSPSPLATQKLNDEAVEREITKICNAMKRNDCSGELVLKDITTVFGNPETLIRWHDVAKKTIDRVFD